MGQETPTVLANKIVDIIKQIHIQGLVLHPNLGKTTYMFYRR